MFLNVDLIKNCRFSKFIPLCLGINALNILNKMICRFSFCLYFPHKYQHPTKENILILLSLFFLYYFFFFTKFHVVLYAKT